ncbi:MAG TPA: GAP family protein [Solirubrobacterales bacterium]|nr:GAP family protein [Solirubrobacterales bacterium]
MGDLVSFIALSLTAMFNPTLLAATTVMMLLPETKRLMLGYLLGSYLTSIAAGLLIVFSFHGSGSVETAKTTLTPAEDLVFGAIALIIGLVLRSDFGEERRRRKKEAKEDGKEPWTQRMLGRGDPRVAFAIGALLSFPGASYLVALNRLVHLDPGVGATVFLVVLFCVIQALLLEVPLVGYAFSPQRTQQGVDRFRRWLSERGRIAGARVAIGIGALLLIRGTLELILT